MAERRGGLGMSGADLSRASGIDTARIARLEGGKRMLDPWGLLAVAEALQTSVEWLLTGKLFGAMPAREVAAEVARSAGVAAATVRAVTSRDVRADEASAPVLYWIDQIRAEEARRRGSR